MNGKSHFISGPVRNEGCTPLCRNNVSKTSHKLYWSLLNGLWGLSLRGGTECYFLEGRDTDGFVKGDSYRYPGRTSGGKLDGFWFLIFAYINSKGNIGISGITEVILKNMTRLTLILTSHGSSFSTHKTKMSLCVH